MNAKGCEFCKYRYEEEHIPEEGEMCFGNGYEKDHYCKKFESIIKKFSFSESFLIKKRQFVLPHKPHGMMCDYFKARI